MTPTSRYRTLITGAFGLVVLAGASSAQAQGGAPRPGTRDTTLFVPPKQPDAVPRPAGPVVVRGAVRPPLPSNSPEPATGPRIMGPPPADPDAPVSRAAVVPESSSNVAESAPQVLASGPLVIVNVTTPPAGSTARCKDGSYISGVPSAQRCADKGGLGVILPEPRQVPSTPRP